MSKTQIHVTHSIVEILRILILLMEYILITVLKQILVTQLTYTYNLILSPSLIIYT